MAARQPADRYRTGLYAESLCRLALRLKGYRIVAARYRARVGEIDIIAARGRTLVAIEVKARPSDDAALHAISAQQRERIARALQDFVMRNPRYAAYALRFDVMSVTPRRWPRHLTNAWHSA